MFLEAVKKGNYLDVKRLAGCERQNINYYKYAIKTNINTVKALLENKNIKPIDSTILFYACENFNHRMTRDSLNMIVFLLRDLKLDPNIHNDRGDHILFCIDKKELFDIFVNYGSDINVKTDKGYNLLLLHCKYNIKNISVIQFFLEKNVDQSVCDEDGNNILHYLIKYYENETYMLFLEYIDLSLMSKKNNKGYTPFVHLITPKFENRQFVSYLINKKICDITETNENGDNIFEVLINPSGLVNFDIIIKFIDNGVNPYHKNNMDIRMIDKLNDHLKNFIDKYMEEDTKEPEYD
jgi:ankyrin repeat protein